MTFTITIDNNLNYSITYPDNATDKDIRLINNLAKTFAKSYNCSYLEHVINVYRITYGYTCFQTIDWLTNSMSIVVRR